MPGEHAAVLDRVLVPERPRSGRREDAAGARARSVASSSLRERTTVWDSWRAFWASRLLIWVVGSLAVVVLGVSPAVHSLDPTGVSLSFGHVGNVLLAPAVRWDSVWYLQIAQHGYLTRYDTGFFPLYPLLVRVGSWLIGSAPLAGVLISLAALFVALELIRRLTEIELGAKAARATVWLLALGPMALFLSAVYTESLFLALSAGAFYAARRERWAVAGVLGGLAALARVGGILLFPPLVLLFFYGPRIGAPRAAAGRWFKPRYPFSPGVLWTLLIPAGTAMFAAYLMLRGFGATATLHAQQQYWRHELVGPITGAWDGVLAARHELTLLIRGFTPPEGESQALLQLGALIVSLVALVGVFRRLPLPYGIYVLLALLMHLSSPTIGDPLLGLDRYASLRFPLFMWAGSWAVSRSHERKLLVVSSLMLAFFVVQFATWHWVGSLEI
jgi:hypothetical protein